MVLIPCKKFILGKGEDDCNISLKHQYSEQHLANQTLLNEMFDSKDTGNVMYDEASLLNRDSTTGFLVYKDSLGDLQTPRFYSIIAQSEHEETIGELKQSKVIDNKETIRPEETFEDELSTLEQIGRAHV